MPKPQVLEFYDFCEKVLKIQLEPGQKVIAKVAFGNHDPIDLPEGERELALELFGGVERVTQEARKYVLLRLGRGSGKTTLCSAFSVYTCVTFDCSSAGPGSIPYVIVIAPDRETAKLSIRMSREMIRSVPALERLVVSDQDQLIQLRRPDGRMVRIESFAATRGGSSVRGRDIMAFLFDEAEFFSSNVETKDGRDYAVNDKDIFDALTPRLMANARGMLISTPWPVETLMSTMFEANWGKCKTAVAILAPTLKVRSSPRIAKMVEEEMERDPENAQRELFCIVDGLRGGQFFDINAFVTSIEETKLYPLPARADRPIAVACDLGFTRDSSAIAVVQFDGKYYRLLFTEELRPKPGNPLKPSEVIRKFAQIAKRYGAPGIVADSYYRESLKEHLAKEELVIFDAPEGSSGKAEVFQRTRAVLHEGLCKIPESPINRRLIQQAKLVSSKPAPGGTVTIKIPRKIGMGHGDIVSAWVLAVHRLAYAQVQKELPTYDIGSQGWFEESQRRLIAYQEKQQAMYLKSLEKDVRKKLDARTLRQFKPR